MTTDLLSNLLTSIRNAVKIKKPYVEVPYSENNYKIVKLLENQGLIKGATCIRLNSFFYQFFNASSTKKNFKKKFSPRSFFNHENIFRKKKFEKNKNRKLNTDELLFVSLEPKQTKRLPSLITSDSQDVVNQNIVKNKVDSSTSSLSDSSLTKTKQRKKEDDKNSGLTIENTPQANELKPLRENKPTNNNTSLNRSFKLRSSIIKNSQFNQDDLAYQFKTPQKPNKIKDRVNRSGSFPKSVDEIFPSITKLQVGTTDFSKKSFFGKTVLNFYFFKHNENFYHYDYDNNFSKQKKSKKSILIALKFHKANQQSVLHHLKRISKPSLRRYSPHPVPKVLNGLGTAIISTSSGLMTDQDARFKKIGGEILAEIW